MLDTKSAASIPIRDLYQHLGSRGRPGTSEFEEESRILHVRLVQEISEKIDAGSAILASSMERLSEVVEAEARQTGEAGKKMVSLNKRLVWLTVLIAILTVVLVAFGGVQLWMMWK